MKIGAIYQLSDDRWRIELKPQGHTYVLELGDAVRLALAILWAVAKWRLGHTMPVDVEP